MTSNAFQVSPLAAPPPVSRRRTWIFLATLLVVVPAVVDLVFPSVNPSIFYLLPLILYTQTPRRRAFRQMTLFLVLLTYACYFAKHFRTGDALSYRLFNRTLVAATLLAVALILNHWMRLRELAALRRQGNVHDGHADRVFEQILDSTQEFTAGAVSVALALAIFVTDLFTPGQFNFPILYAIPLCTAVWTRSRRVFWTVAVLLWVLAIVGWLFGHPPTLTPDVVGRVRINRAIALTVLVGLSAVFGYWTSVHSQRRNLPATSDPSSDPYGD